MTQTEIVKPEIIDILKIRRNNHKPITTQNKFCHVLSCRTQGECTFTGDNATLTAKRGDVIYIPAGSSYTQRHTKESLICFHLTFESCRRYHMQLFTPEDPELICQLFKKAEHIWRQKERNYTYRCLSVLYEIMALTGALTAPEEQQLPDTLRSALEYIHTHMFDTDFSIQDALAAGGVSRTYFNKLFRSCFNTTPTLYINSQRIGRAKQLLRAGSYTNGEIARACGFNEIEYFYYVFKNTTGMTTGQYKKTQPDTADNG